MFRKRRKFNGVWLPPDPYNTLAGLNTNGIIATPSANAVKYQVLNLPNSNGFGSSESYPLVGDLEEDRIVGESIATAGAAGGTTQFNTLNDLSFGYSLKRVVGKLFVGVEQDNVTDNAASAWVITAGIMVRKVDEDGLPQDGDPFTDSYESERDPWLWRRNWLLANSGATPGGLVSSTIWPAANWQFGTMADGPHLDQKTRRTVKSEERLFLDVSAIALNGSDDQTSTAALIVWDLRFFGKVFQSAGNRRNASR